MKKTIVCHPEPAKKCGGRRIPRNHMGFFPLASLRVRMTISATLLIMLFFAGCGGRSKQVVPPKEVEAAKVIMGTIEKNVLFTGNIVAQDAFDVFPRATGKVSKKLLKEGDHVKRGQPILLVERDEVGYTYKQMPVVSLVEGLIGTISVDVGSYVDTNHAVATVVHPEKMRVKLDIPERYLGVLQTGTEVSMKVDYMEEEFKGKIITSSPLVAAKTRTANMEVEIPNEDGRLKHGMFGRINLAVLRHENALTVPVDAISWEGEKRFVYKVEDGKLSRVQVSTGIRNDVKVEITEGLAEDDTVVVGNLLDMKDKQEVTVTKIRSPEEEIPLPKHKNT